MDLIKNIVTCKYCNKILVKPIELPCLNSICEQDLVLPENSKSFLCLICNEEHEIPKEGLKPNQLIEPRIIKCLEKYFENPKYKTSLETLVRLNDSVESFETLQKTKEVFINEYFADVIRKIDLRKERLINQINEFPNQLIHNVENKRDECLNKLKKQSEDDEERQMKLKERKEMIETSRNELHSAFDQAEFELITNRLNKILLDNELEAERLRLEIIPANKQIDFEVSRFVMSKKSIGKVVEKKTNQFDVNSNIITNLTTPIPRSDISFATKYHPHKFMISNIDNGWLCDGSSIFGKCKSNIGKNDTETSHGKTRYRCTVFPDFDLCSECLNSL